MPQQNDALSVRLAEIERNARQGWTLDAPSTLELVKVIRIYMAGFEESRKKIDGMIARLAL